MKKNLLILAGLLISGMILAQQGGTLMKKYEEPVQPVRTETTDNLLYTYKSPFSVAETMQRIEKTLKEMGIPVFAKFDHAKNAEEVGLALRPNQVIVFGSPAVGTKLMQENPGISIELPLKISVWEDKEGGIWAAFSNMKVMAAEYGLEKEPVIGKMQELLERIVVQSVKVD